MKKETEEQIKGKKSSAIKYICTILIIIAITNVTTYMVTKQFTFKVTVDQYLTKANSEYMTSKMSVVKDKLEQSYIYDMPEDKMIEGAVKGYVQGLGDKYTQYLTEEDMKSLIESTTGSFAGIGVQMVMNTSTNTVTIVGVIEDSVAEKAGLKVGDIIQKVDDKEYTGAELDSVASAIKGEEGTKVKLTVMRETEILDFNLTRSIIKIKSVKSSMLEDNIGYIKITSFDDGTSNEFKSHWEGLKKNNPKALVLDLRDNGGGLVAECIKIAETMVNKGDIVLITKDKNQKEKIDKSNSKPIINVPVVILINGNTASASEILAGALRDNCHYKIVGTNSYGKGVIQNVYSFSDGTGIKITTEEYFSPNHNKINKVGIAPDIELELDYEWRGVSNIPYENDKQLQRAVKELQ